MISRRRFTSAGNKSFAFFAGSTLAIFRTFRPAERPIPNIYGREYSIRFSSGIFTPTIRIPKVTSFSEQPFFQSHNFASGHGGPRRDVGGRASKIPEVRAPPGGADPAGEKWGGGFSPSP